MALKDWKTRKDLGLRPAKSFNYTYQGKRYDFISVIPNERDLSGKIFDYSVETRFLNKRFKTKSQALKFAKAYMRKH